MKTKKKLLIPIQWYHPGVRAGGLIQATKRMVFHLNNQYNIYVLTGDRDLGDEQPYTDIEFDIWIPKTSNVKIKYLSKKNCSPNRIRIEINKIQPDFIYLKSIFNPLFSIVPLCLKWSLLANAKIVLGPSGMLKTSALKNKFWKKIWLLKFIKMSMLYQKIIWHATDLQELNDIKKHFGNSITINLLSEFPPSVSSNPSSLVKSKTLKILYLSRIHPVKNLHFLLRLLANVKAEISLTIAGPVEDKKYLLKCKNLIHKLPKNINTNIIGPLNQKYVRIQFDLHHVFVLPTLGEGFGNVILEALAAARPVLISDQTPWRNLQQHKAGWDLPLDRPDLFINTIEQISNMSQEEYDQYCQGALDYAKNHVNVEHLIEQYVEMFTS